MDKMREEFEAWYWGELYSDLDVSSKCVIFSTVSDGSYRGLECNTAWKSWKASRAALCVELPESECGGDGYYYEDGLARGHNDCLELVQSVLDDVGVSCK